MTLSLYTKHNCAACEAVKPLVQEFADEMGYSLLTFDVDEPEGMADAAHNDVAGVPTLLVSDGEMEIDRCPTDGAIRRWLEESARG